jgi:tRNA-2-methylthio-N6-dimethylallyladenosine synthase
MKTACLVTFGCQMNVHDSQRMEELLVADGFTLVPEPEGADVIVLNTCSVREKAEQKLRSEVGRLKRLDALIVVTGCVAQQEGEKLLSRMPHIDAVIGPDNLHELPALLRELEGGAPPQVRAVFDTDAPRFLVNQAAPGGVATSAYVTTMKGCNERCSFCIVPYTRGPERYRGADDIVEEVRRLVEAGVREVVLLGQTVNSYRDPAVPMPEGADPDDSQFPALLRRIVEENPTLARLRYTSPHPRHLTSELLRAHGELAPLAAHVHLPVQSGSDRVLKRMIRRYTRAEFVARVNALRAARPGLVLTTDVIVGFPGETAEDFEQTLSLVREVGFVGLFGFKYSPRPFTPALKLRDDVSEEDKQRRLEALFALSDAQLRDHLLTLVGTRAQVLIEGPSKPGAATWAGRTERNEIVHFAEVAGVGPGALATVEITRANKHSLEGRVERVELPAMQRPRAAFRRIALPIVASEAEA